MITQVLVTLPRLGDRLLGATIAFAVWIYLIGSAAYYGARWTLLFGSPRASFQLAVIRVALKLYDHNAVCQIVRQNGVAYIDIDLDVTVMRRNAQASGPTHEHNLEILMAKLRAWKARVEAPAPLVPEERRPIDPG